VAWLVRTKLDELPQRWHVLRGEMSLVGPRPESPGFVARFRTDYDVILRVRPGITGYTQLAFAREGAILDPSDPQGHYLQALLPQKVGLDRLYAGRASLGDQRAGALDVDRAGELGIPGARRIADDGRQMDDLVDALEALPTGRRVADVGLDDVDPARPQAG